MALIALRTRVLTCLCSFKGMVHMIQFYKNHCTECSISTSNQSEMSGNKLTHRRSKVHFCSECEKSFGQAAHLKQHMLTRGGTRALASTRDFLYHGFHFRPPMYWEYTMCTLYNGWSEVKTLLQKIASARMPPLMYTSNKLCASQSKMIYVLCLDYMYGITGAS